MTSIVGYRMAEFGAFREAFDNVLNHLANNIDPHKGELIGLYRQQLNHIKVMHPKDPMPAHFKYDVRAFLEGVMGFNNPEDLKLTKFARRALRRLKPLTLQPEGWEETQSPMGFVWRPRMDALEKTGYEKINGELNHYLNLPVDDRGKLKSGWGPLQALVNFDQAWQKIAPKDDGLAVILINPGS